MQIRKALGANSEGLGANEEDKGANEEDKGANEEDKGANEEDKGANLTTAEISTHIKSSCKRPLPGLPEGRRKK